MAAAPSRLRRFVSLLAACALLTAAAVHAGGPAPRSPRPLPLPRVIRLRVIAASDTPFDQGVKLAVRDAVLRQLAPVLAPVRTYGAAKAAIAGDLGRLRQAVARALDPYHTAYGARVAFAPTWFPTKAYGNWVLPAGRYQALLVVLGPGAGHNWWCVLFPTLCFIDMNEGLAVPTTPPAPGALRVSWRPPRAAGGKLPPWLHWVAAWL